MKALKTVLEIIRWTLWIGVIQFLCGFVGLFTMWWLEKSDNLLWFWLGIPITAAWIVVLGVCFMTFAWFIGAIKIGEE